MGFPSGAIIPAFFAAAIACSLVVLMSIPATPLEKFWWESFAIVLYGGALLRTFSDRSELFERRASTERERLQEQKATLHRLVTSKALLGNDLRQSLVDICEGAARALEIENVGIWLAGEAGEGIRIAGWTTGGRFQESAERIGTLLSLALQVRNRELRISDLLATIEAEPSGHRSDVLSVPVYLEGRPAGIIRYAAPGGRPWTTDDRNFADSLADLTAMALLAQARRRTEEQLALKSAAIESCTEGVGILDQDERFIFLNQSLSRVFGYASPSELLGSKWQNLFAEAERQRFRDYLMPRFRENGHLTVEAGGRKKGGATIPVELSLTRIEGGGFVCIVKDITLRKKVEQNAQQVALFTTLNPSPVLRFDENGRIVMANPAAVGILQVMQDWSTHLSSFLPSLEGMNLSEFIEQAAVQSFTAEVNSRIFHFVMKGVPYLRVGHLYGTDITELKRAEEELRDSKAFLRAIIDTDPNLIFVKDDSGRFVLVNQAVADMYGSTVEDMVGKTDGDFNASEVEVSHFQRVDQEVLRNGKEKLIPEERITDTKGNVHFLQTVKRPLSLENRKETQLLGVATDITERKLLQDQLIQSHKMEAIGKLAGGIAHDFNNILTGILGYTTLLKTVHDAGPEVVKTADLIENAAHKASQLTQKLLGFARKGKHRNVPIDIHASIKESLSLLARTMERNITLHEVLEAPVSTVLGDPVQMQQILLNLAINARDAIWDVKGRGGAGEIFFSTRCVDVDERSSALTKELRPGSYLEIVIKDDGCGIDESIREKIFDPFFTTKEAGRGTGMGLAMVYGIVKNHGGAVRVESRVGEGTTFSIYLPRANGEAPVEISSSSGRSVQTGRGQILLVDDHSVIRDATSKMLSSLGYDVTTANDGEEAVHYFRQNRASINLVILDMVMPRMGARECFRKMKEIDPNVRAVLSTGYVNNNAVQDILNEGMLGFVQKPYELSELSEVVKRALEDRL